MRRLRTLFAASLLVFTFSIQAQAPAAPDAKPAPADKPTPDVLIFTNGDQLTGQLVGAAGGNIVFKSDMAGPLTIGFDKIKELRSGTKAAQFALLRKGVKVNKKTPAPEGTVSIDGGNVLVATDKPAANTDSSSAPATVPAKDVDLLVAKSEFDHQVSGQHRFLDGWNGGVTGGISLVRSTDTSSNFTASLNLVRALPTVSWLPPRNRMTINVSENYGKNTSPATIPQTNPPAFVTTLSSIFHADAERDEYFSPRFYVLADTSFDHNYAQGLGLQQVYGGGIGWTPIKTPKQGLDLKIDLHYEKQQYITTEVNGAVIPLTTPPDVNLVGSTIFEGYHRNLPRKMIFTQTANILPAFNDTTAYSYNLTAALAIPVFKRLSASVTTTDSFLNDPAPGYDKNSYQFVTGVTYAFR